MAFRSCHAWVENPRVYFIDDGVLKPGLVVIRALKTKTDVRGKPEETALLSVDTDRPSTAANGRGS